MERVAHVLYTGMPYSYLRAFASWGPKGGSSRLAEGPMLSRAAEGLDKGAASIDSAMLNCEGSCEKACDGVRYDHRSRKVCGQSPEHTCCLPLDQILLYRLITSAEHVWRRNSHICCTVPCLRTLRAAEALHLARAGISRIATIHSSNGRFRIRLAIEL
jgi:hypothetical protein